MGLGIKLLILAVVLAAAFGLGWKIVSTYNGAIERAEKAEAAVAARDKLLLKARTDLQDAEATNKGWEKRLAEEKDAQEKLLTTLATRDVERTRLTKERNDARASLDALRRSDASVDAWARAPLPPAIAARLRGPAASPGDGGDKAPARTSRLEAAGAAPR